MGVFRWLAPVLLQTLTITAIVAVLMIITELLGLRFARALEHGLGRRRWLQYLLASAAGSIPGCTGVFAIDALYMAGYAGFGAMVAATVATFGDEAFILIGMAASGRSQLTPAALVALFAALFVLGIAAGWLADIYAEKTKMKFCKKCPIEVHPEVDTTSIWAIPPSHFIKDHIWGHIVKKHIPKTVLWLFGSLVAVKALGEAFDLETVITQNKAVLILTAAAVGILPLSGPNVLFVTMFAAGLMPLSVTLTNCIVQDGHGLLPILAFSVEDAVKIKVFNLVFGLCVGFVLMACGL